ncbi:phosphotransferase KptA/Tpt1 [Ramicandelaber brevisporus]|nr:phosphotransferase KptA/Tpt1 [Ramicandelaber brevisporus]
MSDTYSRQHKGDRSQRRSDRPRSHNNRHESETVQISKQLSYVLRHGAEKLGITMQTDGSVFVDELLDLDMFKRGRVTFAQVEDIVKNCPKQRFILKQQSTATTATTAATLASDIGGRWVIKASQGHSIKSVSAVSDGDMAIIKSASELPQSFIVHGTNMAAWQKGIKPSGGLSKMGRNHIHFATGLPGEDGVISGMRNKANVMIYVDVDRAISDGIVFYKSANNVILTEGVNGVLASKYFTKVTDKDGNDLLTAS